MAKPLSSKAKKVDENYENLFKKSVSFICIIDKEGTIVDVNTTIVKALEYSKSEIIGKRYDAFDAENFDAERSIINEKVWKGNKAVFDKKIKSKNGKILEIEVHLTKGKFQGKEVYISTSRDISVKRELEKQVKTRTDIYKNLVEKSAVAIVFTDLYGNLIEFNNAFISFINSSEVEKEKLINLNINDILINSKWEDETNNINKLINNKEVTIEKQQLFKTKDNQEKHALLKYMLHYTDEKQQLILHQIVDITPIIDTKNKLIESEKSYKNLFNYSNELLYIFDKEGYIIDVNEQVLNRYGYKREEIIGKHSLVFSAPSKNPNDKANEILNNTWEGNNYNTIWWSITKTKEIFPKELSLRKTTYFGKEVILASGRDVSENYKIKNELIKSEKKYKDLIDSSTWGILIFKNERIVFANKKACELTQYQLNELIGKSKNDFITDESNILALNKAIVLLNSGKDVPIKEFTTFTKRNQKLKIEFKLKSIDYGDEICTLFSFINIEDRREIEAFKQQALIEKNQNKILKLQLEQNRQAQIRLRNAQSYAEGVVESSLDMIFTTDEKGYLTKLNSAAKINLKWKEDDYLMKPLQILFFQENMAELILKELTTKKFYTTEILMKKKDGENLIAFISFSQLFTADNAFLGILAICRDITEIKRKEKELNEQAAKLNAIIESSSHFFFTVNKKYLITSFNSHFKMESSFKYGIDIEVNDSFFKLFENQEEAERRELNYFWNRNLNNSFLGKMVEFEMENTGIDGQLYYRQVYLNPIYTIDGNIEEVSGIGQDTTEKRVYEKELKKSLEEKEILLQEVHHRVKNNMQVISSILNLQSAHIDDKKVLAILSESQDRIRAMANIHERLYRTKNFSDIKFSDYIKNLAESIVYSYEYGDAAIELECEIEEIFLNIDRSIPCGLIVNELISNALKYAFKGRDYGKITLKLYLEQGKVTILVKDNGIGIDKKIKLEKADTLGLQLVNSLVEQIEGNIEISNSKGTLIAIKFTP